MTEQILKEIFRHRKGLKVAYEKGQRKALIRVFCLICMGNKPKEVSECSDTLCPFYKNRETG